MRKRRVVVTGVGIICSIGNNRFEVLNAMKEAKIGVNKITQFSTEKLLTHIGAEIKNLDEAEYFKAEEMKSTDRTARLGIIAAEEAILDSGIKQPLEKVGLAFGTCNGGICSIENYNTIDEIPEENFLKYTFYGQTNAIAKHFGISGPINTINTACAASGNAIAFGSDMIKYGYAEIMLAGGADTMSLSVYAGFNSLKALNSDPCSPYSIQTGLTLGEGSAFVMLEDMEKALERDAYIYAEICGYGLSNDGYHATAPDPEGTGICNAVKMAVENAGVPKEKIKYINTHGTGTAANDAAELKGLRQFFGDLMDDIPISSSKAYFGHNLGAAAAIEYVTTLLALREKLLPATMNFSEPREGCDLKNIITNNMLKVDSIPEFFLTNNSAFGGNNCSIISRMGNLNINKSEEKTEAEGRVVITGVGMLLGGAYEKGITTIDFNQIKKNKEEFSLKEYDKNLYSRRMNNLSQMSIAAVDLAIKDARINTKNINEYDVGLCYGTAHGSLKSAEKYLGDVMAKGPDFASSIYFPDMVLNSTAGRIAKALQIKGYSSSLTNGGNEGIYALLSAYHILKENKQEYCIAAAGDEISHLGNKIKQAYGLDKDIAVEGATALMLSKYKGASASTDNIYAEILGFGMNSLDNEAEAITQAIKNAKICSDEIEVVMYNSPVNLSDDSKKCRIHNLLGEKVRVFDCTKCLGYAESISSLNQVIYAIKVMNQNRYKKALVVSHSLGRDVAVLAMSLIE